MQFSVNSEAFKPAYTACLILQTAEAACLEELLTEFVTPEVLQNKLASYNFNFVLAKTLHKLTKSEKIAVLAYSNFAFWPKQMTYLLLEEPELLTSLLKNTWQYEIEDYSSKVAAFDDFISEAMPVKANELKAALAGKGANEVTLASLQASLANEAINYEHSLDLTNLPLIVLEAQANYNCLRILHAIQSLTAAYIADSKFWPNCVNQASLSTTWQIIANNMPNYLTKLAEIDRMSDEMSSFISNITKSLAPLYLPELNELAQKFLAKLKTAPKAILSNDSSLLCEFSLLFAANQAFYGEKKTALHSFLAKNCYLEIKQQELNTFRSTFFSIFDTALERNSGNIYLTEFLIEANDVTLAKRLYNYVLARYTKASLLELQDGQKEWLRALAHYGLQLKES